MINCNHEELVRAAARVPGLAPDERAVLVHLADAAGRRNRMSRENRLLIKFTLADAFLIEEIDAAEKLGITFLRRRVQFLCRIPKHHD